MAPKREGTRHKAAKQGEPRQRRSPWTRTERTPDDGGRPASPWARGAAVETARKAGTSVWARGAAARKELGFDVAPGIRIGRSPTAGRGGQDPGRLAIDLALPIGKSGSAEAPAAGTGYQEMTPDQRADYLAWLASGRQAPGAAKAYIRSYLEGIEHRLLSELRETPGAAAANGEGPRLEQEIERLERRYGQDPDIESWCERILEVWRTAAQRDATPSHLARRAKPGRLPLDVAVRLGRRATAGEKLSTREAYTWWRLTQRSEPDTPQSASERRRRHGFAEALEDHAPQGVRIDPRGLGRLRQAPYKALSGLFEIDLQSWTEDCLDVRTTTPPAQLRKAAESAGRARADTAQPKRRAGGSRDLPGPTNRRTPREQPGPGPAPARFELDEEQLAAARADSAEASAILGEIFGTTDGAATARQAPGVDEPDERHQRLARELAGRPAWTWEQAQAAAAGQGLSAAPAIEELNGWTAARGNGPLASETGEGYEISERAARWVTAKAG